MKQLYLTLAFLAAQSPIIAQPAFASETIDTTKVSSTVNVGAAHKDDDLAIRAQSVDYAKAFNLADIETLANLWDVNAVYNDAEGNVYRGRNAIKNELTTFFKRNGKQQFEISIDSIDFPSDTTAIERGTTRLGSKLLGNKERYIALHIKRDGRWQMVNVSEAPYLKPEPKSDNLADLSWLIGSWSVNGPQGTLHLKSEWIGNKNIIRFDFASEGKDGAKSAETQFVFWNPQKKRICSWQYNSEGGYGEAWWEKIDKSWIWHARSIEPDGSLALADYIIRPEDSDTFSWQSTDRHLLAQKGLPAKRLPDTNIIKATRDKG